MPCLHPNTVRFKRLLIVACGVLSACAPRLERVSARNPDLFEKESDKMQGYQRSPEAVKAPELFVRKRELQTKKIEQPNDTGSLFNSSDERNYLFASAAPLQLGRFLDVKVASNRSNKPKNSKADAASQAGNAGSNAAAKEPAKDAKGDAPNPDADILKSLPDLEPAVAGETPMIKNFKMKILHRYDNGDVLASVTRHSSKDDGDANEITAQGRIPYDRLSSGDQLSTDDLLDVRYVESQEGELIERRSSGWEDEYTARLSGFTEAKSKKAADLDDKRKQLKQAKEGLESRIKALGDERKLVAKQREELNKKAEETQALLKDLKGQVETQESKISDQESKIQSQEEQIQKLENKPQDKQGDKKDGGK